jgi:hypothetical protein
LYIALYAKQSTFAKMPGTVPKVNAKLAAVPDVLIDASGRFKYILCKVFDPHDPDASKLVIRGTARAEFHCKLPVQFVTFSHFCIVC